MSNLKLLLSDKAVADLKDIWAYIATDSEYIADNFLDSLYTQCKELSLFPEKGRKRDELLPGIRSIAYRKYIIFYIITKDSIEVVRILNGFRDLESLL